MEISRNNNKIKTNTYSSNDAMPNRLLPNSVVHLHGSLRDLTEDNVLGQLVLGEGSYVRQYLERSPWYTQFQADIRFASALFIVGYSLSDYHISALLLENPTLAKRTFFIQPTAPNPVFERRTSSYGKTLFIGLQGLADGLSTAPRAKPVSDPTRLKAFRTLDPLRDKKALKAPTAIEIFDLLTFGAFNYARCVATMPQEDYVVGRNSQVQQLLTELPSMRSIVVDGRMGNGKTIYLYLVSLELAAMDYKCFLYRGAGDVNLEMELDLLATFQNVAIFFDEYAAAQDVLQLIADRVPHAKFIVEVRSSIFEVRFHEISRVMPHPYGRVSLNKLWDADLRAMRRLLSNAGFGVSPLAGLVGGSTELRDLLLKILESKQIKDRIEVELKPLFESEPRRRILLLTMLLSRFHLNVDPIFLKIVGGVDPYKEFGPVREIAEEVFETDLDNFRARSAIFADFVVKTFVSSKEVIDCLVEAAIAAAARRSERQYRVLMANLMQYSNIQDLFRGQRGAAHTCVEIYERLRMSPAINSEPLFWLQYAIAMAEDGQLEPAQNFIDTAYERAAATPGFETYQIDTQALRIVLALETARHGEPVGKIDQILQKLELVSAMLNEESHRTYAIKIVDSIGPFLRERAGDLTKAEKNGMVFWITQIVDALARLPANYRARTGSDLIKARLDSAKSTLMQA